MDGGVLRLRVITTAFWQTGQHCRSVDIYQDMAHDKVGNHADE